MADPNLNIEVFVDQVFGENACVLHAPGADETPVGWIIDPSFPPQVQQLLAYIARHRIQVEKIILTHGHADHIAGLDFAHTAHPEAEVWIARPDEPMLTDADRNLSAPFGLPLVMQTRADHDLAPGLELLLGSFAFRVLDTSGHSPGGRSLYCPAAGLVLAGDALFAGSIGRTDFPGCDHARLIRNIRESLLTLPDDTVVYSGHGPTTRIGIERKSNPFVSE